MPGGARRPAPAVTSCIDGDARLRTLGQWTRHATSASGSRQGRCSPSGGCPPLTSRAGSTPAGRYAPGQSGRVRLRPVLRGMAGAPLEPMTRPRTRQQCASRLEERAPPLRKSSTARSLLRCMRRKTPCRSAVPSRITRAPSSTFPAPALTPAVWLAKPCWLVGVAVVPRRLLPAVAHRLADQ